ncbi:MAG TPA: ABC transporter ATP-binding protein [Iamia sp.]
MIRSDWRRLSTLLPHGARSLVGVAALGFLSAALEAVVLVLVVASALAVTESRDVVDVPLFGSALDPTVGLVAAGLASVLSLLGHVLIADRSARLSAQVSSTVRNLVIDAFAAAGWARQAADREGALQETVTTLANQSSQLALNFTGLLVSGVSLAALFVTAFVVDPVVTVVVVVFAGLIFLVLRPLNRITRRRAKRWVGMGRAFAEGVASWSTMAMDVRVFGVEDVKRDELRQANADLSRAMYRTRVVGRVGSNLYKDLALLFLVGAVAGLRAAGDVDLTAVGAVVLLIVRSVNYAQQAQGSLQQVGELSPSLEAALERVESLRQDTETWGDRPLERITEIGLRDVGYDYEPGRVGVDGIDVRIEAGDVLGVIGPSGGGKSTLVQLLLRLRLPTRGSITVSGVPYEELDPAHWRRLVALVPQEPRLFEGTVAENIAFFRTWVGPDDVEQAAAAAHVLDDIRRLEHGMETRLGPRGSGLSGGQKQRIAIARALVGRPQLLVLDEPTSALDLRSEELLQETIDTLKGEVTMVIITHRLSTLRSCDRVLVLEHGRQQQFGPREEVLATAAFLSGIMGPRPGEASAG